MDIPTYYFFLIPSADLTFRMKHHDSTHTTYVDILNILAIIGVIFLHHNGIVHRYHSDPSWRHSLVVECTCYYAVPVFIMLSGATLMPYRKRYSTTVFFTRRVMKVGIPTVAWKLLMYLFRVYVSKDIQLPRQSLKDVMTLFFNYGEEFTYYFLFWILSVYLTLPVISHLADPRYNASLWYAVSCFFILNSAVPNILSIIHFKGRFDIQIQISGLIFYVLMGYLLSISSFQLLSRLLLYLCGCAAVIYRYLTTLILSQRSGKRIELSYGYFNPPAILESIAVFTLIKTCCEKQGFSKRLSRLVQLLSSCSFGVYLIHKMIMWTERRVMLINDRGPLWRLGFPFVTYILCVCIVSGLKRIPLVKFLVP